VRSPSAGRDAKATSENFQLRSGETARILAIRRADLVQAPLAADADPNVERYLGCDPSDFIGGER
jgi:hypothetical protein